MSASGHRAAVAVVECAVPAPSVLLVRRAERVGDPWSGQWALPGGRREDGDADDLATCLRELAEEVGLALPRAACVAALPGDVAGRHLGRAVDVAPFLFRLDAAPTLLLQAAEVAATRWLPVDLLRDPARQRRGEVFALPDQPFIDVDGVPLWGLTYRVLRRRYAGA